MMIDIHCHILPGVDDGSDSLQTSLMMGAMAADDGVNEIICTPHYTGGEKITPWLDARDNAFQRLSDRLSAEKIPLKLHRGAEVLCTESTIRLTKTQEFPALCGTHYSLVEFYFDEKQDFMTDCLQKIWECGLVPIIAHPERYGCVQDKKNGENLLDSWLNAGYYLQLNAGSLNGMFGRKVQKTARWILYQEMPSFLATDAHSTSGRNTRLAKQTESLNEEYESDYIKLLTETNPLHLLRDENLEW